MSLKRNLSRFVYENGSTRRVLQEWHAFPGRKWVRKTGAFASKSWSEHGEDTLLLKIGEGLEVLKDGFYVDVGANLPTRRSNTFALYCQGMRGLCLEPNLELAALFEKARDEDDVVCAAVGDTFSVASFWRFNFHVFSTCSESVAQGRLEGTNQMQSSLQRSSLVPMIPLRELLKEYFVRRKDEAFFLLKADTEGFDLEVLRSNDWSQYRPICVLTESTGQTNEISLFLQEKGYRLAHSFPVNQLFVEERSYSKCVELGLLPAEGGVE